MKLKYYVKKDRFDARDLPYRSTDSALRESVDLRIWASPVENQQHLGSCTGQAVVGAYELLLNQKYPQLFEDLSRLFVYYNARLVGGNVLEDEGAYVRDAIKAVKNYGVCDEEVWPYIIENFDISPTDISYEDAKSRNIKNYYRITKLTETLDALNRNYPVIFGTLVYDSFDRVSSKNGILNMPTEAENVQGGHAMCLVGYDIRQRLLLARNSFGKSWGLDGYCWIPFDYAERNFMDMWVIDVDLTV
jgi:C1A family cysteine protease